MSKLIGISGREVIGRLQKAGFIPVRQRGSHVRMVRASKPSIVLTVPMHDEIKIGTLLAILRAAKLTKRQFEELA